MTRIEGRDEEDQNEIKIDLFRSSSSWISSSSSAFLLVERRAASHFFIGWSASPPPLAAPKNKKTISGAPDFAFTRSSLPPVTSAPT